MAATILLAETLSAQLATEAGNIDAALEFQSRAPLTDVFLAALRLLTAAMRSPKRRRCGCALTTEA